MLTRTRSSRSQAADALMLIILTPRRSSHKRHTRTLSLSQTPLSLLSHAHSHIAHTLLTSSRRPIRARSCSFCSHSHAPDDARTRTLSRRRSRSHRSRSRDTRAQHALRAHTLTLKSRSLSRNFLYVSKRLLPNFEYETRRDERGAWVLRRVISFSDDRGSKPPKSSLELSGIVLF